MSFRPLLFQLDAPRMYGHGALLPDVGASQAPDRGAFPFLHQSGSSRPFCLRDYADLDNRRIWTRDGSTLWAMNDRQEVLGTWEHYLVGCSYAWQKVQRAAMSNRPLDSWSSSYRLAAFPISDSRTLDSDSKDEESIYRIPHRLHAIL